MSLLDDLRRQKAVFIECPHCADSFPAKEAQLFDATKRMPPEALEKLEELKAALITDRKEHKLVIQNGQKRTEVAAKSTNIGKVVEKIAPSLKGFPANPAECRSLFEPIDYIVFNGLSEGDVESLVFVDVKSGAARLSGSQRAVRDAVEQGRIKLHVAKGTDVDAAQPERKETRR